MNRQEFDARFKVEPCPDGRGFYVADTIERKVEAGPMPTRSRAEGVLLFMRQHCEAPLITQTKPS